ncbi:MAG: hypothetical protein CMJ18_25905 [Phycisphaeraceae bacterium]|nr:hypothetical protein [Phycisphaeraceae bacterium]
MGLSASMWLLTLAFIGFVAAGGLLTGWQISERAEGEMVSAGAQPSSDGVRHVQVLGTTISIHEKPPADWSPALSRRDPTVFTAGTGKTPYFYTQAPTATSVQLRAETNYHDLSRSRTVKVEVTGLSPNTQYFYRVGDSNEFHRFRTMPEGGRFVPFQFTVIGDTQSAYDTEGFVNLTKDRFEMGPFAAENDAANADFNDVTEAMRRRTRPDLIMHVGDIIEDARYSVQWSREQFLHLKYLLTLAPVYPVMGNHEYHDPRFHRFYELPIPVEQRVTDPERAYYSFDWGPVHFICLDINAHWYTIYDIDQVPTTTTVSRDFDGQDHRYPIEQVVGDFTVTGEALELLKGHIRDDQIASLRALQGPKMDRQALQAKLRDLNFEAAEDRKIRTATIEAAHRNMDTGRVELLIEGGDLRSRQAAWMRADLEANRDKPFIFVFTHHPVFMNGKARPPFTPILEEFAVSAVFSGHAHVYHHEHRNAVHYFVTGGGGDVSWSRGEPAVTKRADGDEGPFVMHRFGQQYMIVDVEADRAVIVGVDLDNEVFEETVIVPRGQ